MQKLLFVVLAVALSGCATQSRPRANLAIDSEPSALPEPRPAPTTTTTDDSSPTDQPIDLGFEGSSGRVRVEAAMTPEEEEEALRSDEDDEEEDSESDDELEPEE